MSLLGSLPEKEEEELTGLAGLEKLEGMLLDMCREAREERARTTPHAPPWNPLPTAPTPRYSYSSGLRLGNTPKKSCQMPITETSACAPTALE